ncbi:cutinase [Rhizoctonia solani]|uniref:Cutinase n=1 Tax=Rhizoctonia solani TaxID=456999 RepID=A0A8H8P7P2_9AGAM|nr:cutinase [Rhizoctonia solani]QRW25328.1 cutinase [Rhizoctonia solani]
MVFLAGTNEEGLGLAGKPSPLLSVLVSRPTPFLTTPGPSTALPLPRVPLSSPTTFLLKLPSAPVRSLFLEDTPRVPWSFTVRLFPLFSPTLAKILETKRYFAPSTLKAKVKAIVVFGDPYRSSSSTWPINSPVVDSAPRDGSTASQNVASFCNSGDLFCDGGLSVPAHLAYGTDGSTTVAATFIKNKVA